MFGIKGAKRTGFVRKGTEATKGAEAFQAYDSHVGKIAATKLIFRNRFDALAPLKWGVSATYRPGQ